MSLPQASHIFVYATVIAIATAGRLPKVLMLSNSDAAY
jgi:hypothetical protein